MPIQAPCDRSKIATLFCFCFALIIAAGCQTNPIKKFPDVKNGMEKHDVLEVIGNPTRTERFNGEEKWVYRFYDDDQAVLKQVTFDQSGKVISAGDDAEEAQRVEEIKSDDAKRKDLRARTKKVRTENAATENPATNTEKTLPPSKDNAALENPNSTFKEVPGRNGENE